MSGRIFPISLTQAILDGSRKLRSLSDLHCHSLPGFEPPATPQLQLHLPEVWAPAQYLIDMGLRPTFARRLSSIYMDVVARYRETCQSHFNRATHGGHLTEYYHKVFIVLFRRTVQAWESQIVSIVRVQLCQAGALQVTVHPERVDASIIIISKTPRNAQYIVTQIRVDDAAQAEIVTRLGLKSTHLSTDRVGSNRFLSFCTSDQLCQMVTSPSANVTSRLKEVSEQVHALSTDTVDSRLMVCSWSMSVHKAHLYQVARIATNLVNLETP